MAQKDSYLSEDTIAALSTPTGGAVAIIRMSGPVAFKAHQKLIREESSDPQSNWNPSLRRMNLSTLYSDTGEMLDQALWVAFQKPDTYTAEDLIEYHIHGNAWIAQRLLETLMSFGVRQALPGEFSFRAVRNGKMTLFQAQGVADLIAATNDSAVSVALEKMTGNQSQQLVRLGQKIREIAVLSEVGIDFADQDVDEVSLPRLKERLQQVRESLDTLLQSYRRGIQLQDGVRVALVGLPNAGKSSFFNAFLGQDRSIVSDIAGTTRDIIRERITLQGETTSVTLRLEDTAGLRTTQDQIEKFGIEKALAAAQQADLILWVCDPSQSLDPMHLQEITPLITGTGKNRCIAIISKSDISPRSAVDSTQNQLNQLGISTLIEVSSLTGNGIGQAAKLIAAFCEKNLNRKPGELILTRIEHFKAVQEALSHLNRALDVQEVDLFASDLRQVLSALSPLIGDTLPDDILGQIFSNFCIGK